MSAVFNAFEFLSKEDSDEDDEDEEGEEGDEWSSDLTSSPGVSSWDKLLSVIEDSMKLPCTYYYYYYSSSSYYYYIIIIIIIIVVVVVMYIQVNNMYHTFWVDL